MHWIDLVAFVFGLGSNEMDFLEFVIEFKLNLSPFNILDRPTSLNEKLEIENFLWFSRHFILAQASD